MLRTLCVLMLASGLAFAADPFLGTWKMNPAKSKYSSGSLPKSATLTFTEEGGWVVGKNEVVNADGTTASRTNKYKRDGKEYPFEGPLGKGTISVKATGEREATTTFKLDGNTAIMKTVISADGKTRTMTTTGKNGRGEAVNNTVVYDRQ